MRIFSFYLVGLGKTIQALAMLALLHIRYKLTGTHLIVAPGSTLENWRREIDRWLPNHSCLLYHGSQDERESLRNSFKSTRQDIILTTYTYFERESCSDDRKFLYQRKFEYCIFDEAHAIKNFDSQRYKSK